MIFLIAVGLTLAAIVIGLLSRRYQGEAPFWLIVIIAIAAAFAYISCLVFVMSTPTGRGAYPNPDTKMGERSLVALNNGTNQSGSFFLGTGTVDEELVYRYLVDGEWGAELKEVRADYARVVEGGGDPRIEFWANCSMSHFVPWPACTRSLFVFHVPEGSIARDYVVAP